MPIKYTKAVEEDLTVINSIEPEKISEIIEILQDLKSQTIKPSEIRNSIGNTVSEDQARSLVRAAVNFQVAIQKNPPPTSKELFEEIGDEFKITQEHLTLLKHTIDSEPIILAAKAYSLSYDHPVVFLSVRSKVDIRPVFGVDRTKVVGSITIPTLTIEYGEQSSRNRRELSLAMDEKDLKELADTLRDIVNKIKICNASEAKVDGVSYFVAGEEEL
ncbi:hypothetical protein J7481_12945 [Labrenzia sp. R4_2]|uniref:hypothetical protein n=1 Tax=Labrenzia sp. R4_2 TaxID=2821107 RepID=UPI001ADD50FD|nr:hypothetical protein [Labrenzia sp. R4_2]MBO9420402.1 hypothetical protein [Labrenzia sp. R4_2]